MKTGNTLRTAKNSLLCFFMTLAGGFLVACGSDGGGVARPGAPSIDVSTGSPPSFSAYLVDTAVEGVEYSGPTGNGVTGEGGVFLASEGEFEFSIGATDLGRVSLNSEWENNEVTPSDLVGVVSPDAAITIARIMQGLDADANLQNGISISQGAREHPEDLSALLDVMGTVQISNVVIGGDSYTIPSVADARAHLLATRQCLFSGGYVGDYRANGDSDERGTVYYAVEPFADQVRRFGFTAGDVSILESFRGTEVLDVDVFSRTTGTERILIFGVGEVVDELDFITPRLVRGNWDRVVDGTVTVSGTHELTVVAGNPGATRRIVGVQTPNGDDDAPAAGMYVLDYFASDNEANGGSFSGQYYEVVNAGTVSVSPLMLTIATDGGSWDSVAMSGLTTTLTLIGTRGESDMTIALQIARADDNHGTVSGIFADPDTSELSGTWCDIGGAVGSTVAPTPPTLSNTDTVISITWDAVPGATVYNLYRSTVSVGSAVSVTYTPVGGDITTTFYTDSRDSAETEYFYRLEACNSAGCSERSDEVRTNPPQDPAAGGNALVGSAQSEIEADWGVKSLAMSHSRIGGDVSAHRLSRYLDSGIDGVQILG